MSEKQAPYNVKEARPQRSFLDRAIGRYPVYYLAQEEEGSGSTHEHLFRVALGNGLVLRWCERCGKSFLLQQANELAQRTTAYQWVEIQEPMAPTVSTGP